MKFMVTCLLIAFSSLANALPQLQKNPEAFATVFRDDRVNAGEDGTNYAVDFETDNEITVSESGDGFRKIGTISYVLPDGTPFHMKYVADENGFQPESSHLPVAPAFPHPIPAFVLEQIEFAKRQKEEDAARIARGEEPLYDY